MATLALTFLSGFLAHSSQRLIGELIVYQSSQRLSVCVSVNIFKLEYLRNQWANRNQILSEASELWLPWQPIAPIGI